MRIAFLWPRLAGYMNACLKALASQPGVELFVCNQRAGAEDPFERSQFAWMDNRYEFQDEPEVGELSRRLAAFQPELVLGGVWNIAAYRHVCRNLGGRCLRVCLIDNQWRGTVKQYCGMISAPWYLHRLYDAIFVPGERQFRWARHMGFAESQIWFGSLSCDVSAFQSVRDFGRTAGNRVFLFVGRMVAEKGIQTLASGYRKYVCEASKPWPLCIAGVGPLADYFRYIPNVIQRGFVQPEQLPELFKGASCLVLPSVFEPWGIVIHEAVCSGLPVICSSECGASVHLVQDGLNGIILPPCDVDSLAAAFHRFSGFSWERRLQMAEASGSLAGQFTPARWARTVLERVSTTALTGSLARAAKATCSREFQ
jgi:glycosyltransferase involved in cell wall biosynthesis